jgi:predicted protein tyrosine phosphatase
LKIQKILFLCSQNKLRSPTAEAIFSTYPDLEVASAGLNNDADIPLSSELVEWAEIIFVMEKKHRMKLSKNFNRYLKNTKIVCLDIPDNFDYMEPALIALLETKVKKYLRM